ncbi:zinc-dependent peptidase [Rhodothermus profundi]|uniref:Zinc-dependent peptidase n=1 Tax=Rhodothermus profundi TaxID=633813 RepID=A0A1M6QCT9_9BACT|nr:zinc-dependent peptidase [Rhodothermus profundi]SHK18062.1 hypothetical protein SAMN04488087_0568 [Rhodothermus profundi]
MRIVRPVTVWFYGILALVLGSLAALVGLRAGVGGWPGVLVGFGVLLMGIRKPLRRWRLARRPFPASWRRWLEVHVPFYRQLDAQGRRRFERDVQFFLAEQRFEGVGVAVTDELRLAVAAGAALLLHGRPDWEWPAQRTFLFYADRFDEDYYEDAAGAFDGMAHAQGPIILSVKAVQEGWAVPHDGSNVVLHELAHVFDFGNLDADGMPTLLDPTSAEAWRRLIRQEMVKVRQGRSLLRPYAATNAAEFFAVAVENFFERPELLAYRHAELFAALRAFFNLDPRHPGRNKAEQ